MCKYFLGGVHMRKSIRIYVAGLLTSALILSGTLAFAETTQMIEAVFGRVKLVVNDESIEQETLLYNGTTYVPLRAAAEVLEKELAWDEENQIAYIDEVGTGRTFGAVPTELKAPSPTPKEAQEPNIYYNPNYNYYDKTLYPEVPDLASIQYFKSQFNSWTDKSDIAGGIEIQYIFTIDEMRNNYGTVLQELGFDLVSQDEKRYEYAKNNIVVSLVSDGLVRTTIAIVNKDKANIDATTAVQLFGRREVENYLNETYGVLNTDIGQGSLRFSVSANDGNLYMPYDYSIRVEHSGLDEIEFGNNHTIEQRNNAKNQLRQVMVNIEKDLSEKIPDVKLKGDFTESYYDYPALKVGMNSTSYGNWKNYGDYEYGSDRVYETVKRTEFQWQPQLDIGWNENFFEDIE
jgi:hypothetical protein